MRSVVGMCLRLPIVVFVGLLWMVYLWWVIVVFSIVVSAALIILQPAAYPLLYALMWLSLAFGNSSDPVLPGYWSGYPGYYFRWCWRCIRLGFPTLRRWLVVGF